MTEAEWLACEEPEPMLDVVLGKVSDRKLRLFAVACYLRVWQARPRSSAALPAALLVSEAFADGLVGAEQLEIEQSKIGAVAAYSSAASASSAAGAILGEDATTAAYWTARHAANYFGHLAVQAAGLEPNPGTNAFASGWRAEARVQAALVPEIFGVFPFRLIAADPEWLLWNNATLPRIAGLIYADRAFDRLPILADALQDAGCTNADILAHCRGGGDHVRGCWVVDLILEKE
jgi:hypothetical protein